MDGVDAAGKTSLAYELRKVLLEKKQNVTRASIDGFHNPGYIRYKRGKDSPEGYFYDSFNYDALIENLLMPLGPDGNLNYKTSIFDFRTDSETYSPTQTAHRNSILLFDGVFLLRHELIDYWDYKIFVDVDFEVSLRRATRRDKELFGSESSACERYFKRYIPGQKIYLNTVNPKTLADVVVKNNEPDNAVVC
ncbi:hypothetical protein ACFLSV_06835 [Bacteroidota bacterium]